MAETIQAIPSLRLWEFVHVRVGGLKELQETDPLATQCGIDAQKQQVIADAIFSKCRSHDAPSGCKKFDRVLGCVVVP